ncbi:MAG: haloacid dehalogenase type II [Alphaproteobacteria bacterium]|nr:MAG: haloacid dehalogenase type II [Alphaproteobacteria bacterium]
MAAWTGIKACVFDAYGTLFDIHSPTARIADELGEKAQPLSDLWRAKQLQYTWLRSLMDEYVEFWQVTGDALDYAMAAHGIDNPDIRQRLMDMYLSIDAYPDAVATLEALKARGFQTAILSNGSRKMLDAAVENSGLGRLLDQVLSVEEVGIYKPDRRVYQLAVDRTGAAPEEICFVSANAWDCSGGANFGFQNAHINRFGQPEERLPGTPRAVITSLSELPPLLA